VTRAHLPSLIVLSGAIAAGAAAFVVVGRTAGALYGVAAVILGLIFQQKLVRGQREQRADTPRHESVTSARTGGLPIGVPRGRKAALREELSRVSVELDASQQASAALARQLDEQRERTSLLEASFAERVSELTHSLDLQSLELSSERASHAERLQTRDAELGQMRQKLGSYESALAERTRQLELEQRNARELGDRLTELTAAYREELGQLAWSWRAHVEEIAALEAAVDAAVRSS
jgi:hypothetical protein